MKRTLKALLSCFSVLVFLCVLAGCGQLFGPIKSVDVSKNSELASGGSLKVDASVCSISVTVDAQAASVSARLHGTWSGWSGDPELKITADADTLLIEACKNWVGMTGGFSNLQLDVTVPSGFSGDLACKSSSGSVTVRSDVSVKSLNLNSSSGSVTAANVTSEGAVIISCSSGSVEAGDIKAASLDMHTSSGGVKLRSCKAETIRLHSSSGSVSAGNLSGKIEDASSSSGSVDITLADVAGSAEISSSSGSVRVSLPAGAGAEIDAHTSSGSVNVQGLTLANLQQSKSSVKGSLNGGGPLIKISASSGSVDIIGK